MILMCKTPADQKCCTHPLRSAHSGRGEGPPSLQKASEAERDTTLALADQRAEWRVNLLKLDRS